MCPTRGKSSQCSEGRARWLHTAQHSPRFGPRRGRKGLLRSAADRPMPRLSGLPSARYSLLAHGPWRVRATWCVPFPDLVWLELRCERTARSQRGFCLQFSRSDARRPIVKRAHFQHSCATKCESGAGDESRTLRGVVILHVRIEPARPLHEDEMLQTGELTECYVCGHQPQPTGDGKSSQVGVHPQLW